MSDNQNQTDADRARRASQLLAEMSPDEGSLVRLKHELANDAANLAAEVESDDRTDDAAHSTEEI